MTFYRVDTTKLALREYWHWKPGIPFVLLALKKLLGFRTKTPQCCARPETLLRVEPGDLPARHRRALDPLLVQSRDLGFALQFLYSVPMRGHVTGVAAALTSGDHSSLAVVAHSEPENARRPIQPAFSFFSCFSDGRILATSGGLPGLIGVAPEFQMVRLRHGPLSQTWRRHSERIRTEVDGPIPFRSEDVSNSLLRIVQRNFDYNIERGVWIPVAELELEELRERA